MRGHAVLLLLGLCACAGPPGTKGDPKTRPSSSDIPDGSPTFAGHDVPSSGDTAEMPDAPVDPGSGDPGAAVPDPGIEPETGSAAEDTGPPEPPAHECPPPCPLSEPVCEEGKCLCTGASCPSGKYCDGLDCRSCVTDSACGSGCTNCLVFDKVCSSDGHACVECRKDVPCKPGQHCAGGACVPCESGDACGPSCVPCSGQTPACIGGKCSCTEGSCGPGTACAGGACKPCDFAAACGPACTDCTKTGMPVCIDGKCKCTEDAQCGAGTHCVGGMCEGCTDNDPLHCGPTCAICSGTNPTCSKGKCICEPGTCAEGKWCTPEGKCKSCTDNAHCGAKCLPCGAAVPICKGDSCVACLEDADCGAGTWCSGDACAPCSDDDPLHCGPSCNVCGPGALCAGGACLPCDTTAACGPACAPCAAPAPFCGGSAKGCIQCLATVDCPAGQHCEGGACVPDCSASGCTTDTGPDGKKCSTAKVVGRKNAASGFLVEGDTTDDGNNDDLSTWDSDCWDANEDNFYRIYLLAGEQVTVTASPLVWDFDLMLKLYQGQKCDDDKSTLITCVDGDGDGDPEKKTFAATKDGWVTVVVDGRSAFFEDGDWGKYSIAVSLACKQPDCCCP